MVIRLECLTYSSRSTMEKTKQSHSISNVRMKGKRTQEYSAGYAFLTPRTLLCLWDILSFYMYTYYHFSDLCYSVASSYKAQDKQVLV